MDFAYDQIYVSDRSGANTPKPSESITSDGSTVTSSPTQQSRPTLQDEFQETFKAFSASPWGAKLGGWWSTARTQSASYLDTARKEAEKREVGAQRALEAARQVVTEKARNVVVVVEDSLDRVVNEERGTEGEIEKKAVEGQTEQTTDQETETLISRFKATAVSSLAELQKAEDAADEALLRFGSNVRNFLRDTISIVAPDTSNPASSTREVLFETTGRGTGRRVIHTSRLDAQLHSIHTNPSAFESDPTDSEAWLKWKEDFKIDDKTEEIAHDLEKYPDLRQTMEFLAELVPYTDFWTRYYFLRHAIEEHEARRKELLKASISQDEEEVGWGEDSDSEERPHTSQQDSVKAAREVERPPSAEVTERDADTMTLKPASPRRSHDDTKSVADSDASYDLVSGAASHAASSPKEKPLKEESDEDDWE